MTMIVCGFFPETLWAVGGRAVGTRLLTAQAFLKKNHIVPATAARRPCRSSLITIVVGVDPVSGFTVVLLTNYLCRLCLICRAEVLRNTVFRTGTISFGPQRGCERTVTRH
jgi:hypothetical protein